MRKQKRDRSPAPGPVIRASELNSYEYCHRAWWLRTVTGVAPPPEAAARLEAGTARHAAHGRGLWLAGALRRAGLALLVLGAVLGALWWWLSVMP
jgi:hypothetical protein